MLRSNAAIDLSRRNVVDGAMEGAEAEYHMFIASSQCGLHYYCDDPRHIS